MHSGPDVDLVFRPIELAPIVSQYADDHVRYARADPVYGLKASLNFRGRHSIPYRTRVSTRVESHHEVGRFSERSRTRYASVPRLYWQALQQMLQVRLPHRGEDWGIKLPLPVNPIGNLPSVLPDHPPVKCRANEKGEWVRIEQVANVFRQVASVGAIVPLAVFYECNDNF
ncbi:MAG: hypothetical protein OXL97_07790 [Chloroflexota bacterium]|nr:hypothetical protein [Chloroflexota bacterium]MDE2883792.1 hypothetical protein [Chloroflexota bacterium]